MKLKQLLNQSKDDAIVKKCFDAFQQGNVLSVKSTAPMPTEHVQRIYSIRAELNKQRGSGVEGYDSLLRRLSSVETAETKVHLVKTVEDTFGVFTDDLESELFGILLIPNKQGSI